MSKAFEKYIFEKFQQEYNDMPTGEVIFSDRPDVIIKTSTKDTIGIEITECIYDEKLMSESEYQIRFNKLVMAELEKILPYKFILSIELDSRIPLKQSQVESVIHGLTVLCSTEFANLEPNESRSIEQLDVDWGEGTFEIQQLFYNKGYRKMPKGISRIRICTYENLANSYHPESKGGAVPNFTSKQLGRILEKKEKSLKSYQTCTSHWLLIVEGRDFYSYMDQIEVEAEFSTNFDKVFIYRLWNSEVVIIK
jgi:hypothetical protein